ncbi:MAG: energy-coupling factor ABC transporter permease [Burkholderiales bacterium]|nr:MAG: energy-coupling factor ABC transporter permease [Burkholderiales bacterium]
MNLPAAFVPGWLSLAATILMLLALGHAWRQAAHGERRRPTSPHLLGGLIVGLSLLWLMRASPIQGSSVQMLGAALALFLLDAPLAVLAMSLVAVLDAAFGGSPWALVPLNAALHGLLPVLLTGMLVTVFVVYRPQWVATFDDARYLRRRVALTDRIDR